MGKVCVVGSINLDLIADVARLPKPGETVSGRDFRTAPGGKGANQALAAARAGAATRMIGATGRDTFAAGALACLTEGKVDLSQLRQTHAATGTALILVETGGENVIAVVPGANAALVPGDLSRADFQRGEVILLQQEIPLAVNEAALDAAAAAGATSILNTAPFHAKAAAMLGKADIVVANETEFDLYADALGLTGKDRAARMADFCTRHGRILIVTLGAEGVRAVRPSGASHIAALPVEPVDTVGAGDTFCGYLGAGLAAGLELDEALRRAAAAGSLACLKPGAQPAIPHAKDVDAALAGQ